MIFTRPISSAESCDFDSSKDTIVKANIIQPGSPARVHTDIKDILASFLTRSGFQWGITPPNSELRSSTAAEVRGWDNCGNVSLMDKIVDHACTITECAYSHLSSVHLRYVAIYTACVVYCDDIGGKQLEAIRQFATRLTRGQPQLTPVLDTLVELLRQAHDLWPAVGADAIVSGTIDGITGMYLEYTTQEMKISPHAQWWPGYLRIRTGILAPYIHFIFMKGFRETPESYLQMLPYMEHWIGSTNDVLSFYKEELAGETGNYIHNRAQAERLPPLEVFRRLAQKAVDSAHTIGAMCAGDEELKATWLSFLEAWNHIRDGQGYIQFHVNSNRYKLVELLSGNSASPAAIEKEKPRLPQLEALATKT